MAWLAVDEFNDEKIFQDGWIIFLPKGSILRLIGRELSWQDEPVELTEETLVDCNNCKPASGFNHGTTCPKCFKPFREIAVTPVKPVKATFSENDALTHLRKKYNGEVTDEEINDKAQELYDVDSIIELVDWIDGARWMRERMGR